MNIACRWFLGYSLERVFAVAKEKHEMQFTYLRGLTRVTDWVRLKSTTMNLKKYALKGAARSFFRSFSITSPVLSRAA